MPTNLIEEVREELSLCLVGSPGSHPLLSLPRPPLCSSSSCHHREMGRWGDALWVGMWERTHLQEARVCEAGGKRQGWCTSCFPRGASPDLFLHETTPWATHPPFPGSLWGHWGSPWPHLETTWCFHTLCGHSPVAVGQIHLKNNPLHPI